MSVNVDPFVIPIPQKLLNDPELGPTFQYLWKFLYDIWSRTGAGADYISDLTDDFAALDVRVDVAENDIDALDLRVDALEAAPGTHADTVEYDFGTSPVYDAQFTITDAAISASSVVSVVPGGAATGRTGDDWQWDGATVGVVPGSGTATCYVTFHPGPIVGPRTFNYTVI